MGLLDFKYEDAMSNPLLQMGLGIMANNQGHGGAFMPAFGGGVQQGMANLAQYQDQLRRKQLQDQQIQMQKAQFDMQKAKYDQSLKSYADTQAAIEEATRLHPELAGAFKIDPKAAIKVAYPTLDGENSNYSLASGIAKNPDTGKWDKFITNRKGEKKFLGVDLGPNPALWKIADETGQVADSYSPVPNIAPQPQVNNAPQSVPVPSAIPYTWSGPTATDIKEGTSPDMVLKPIPLPNSSNLPPASRRKLTEKQGEANIDIQTKKDLIPVNAANASAVAQAEATGKAKSDLADAQSTFPQLDTTIGQLKDMSSKMTYTKAGQLRDSIITQLGMPATEGAVQREKYINTVRDVLFPQLRQIFGAQFTAAEGERLIATLGNPDKTPQERNAALDAFIEQKKMHIQSMQRRVGDSSQKTVVKRGKYGGRNVVQYSDGSVDYAD